LIEEVARVYGYGKIATTLPRAPLVVGKQSPQLEAEERARALLIACGLSETFTYSLTDGEWASDCVCLPIIRFATRW